jgi:hypothetical protein
MSRRKTLVGLVLVLALAVAVILVVSQWAMSAAKATAKPKPSPAPAKVQKPLVLVQAYYPLNDQHKYIVDYLRQFAKAHPRDVKLEVYDTLKSEGRRAWTKTGLTCAGVFINGKTKWEVKKGNKTETVNLIKKMDVFWTRKDFETVVNDLLAKARKKAK